MAKSMTGWGKGDFSIGADQFTIEMKALNNRFIDISLRSPERFSSMENRIRDEIKKRFSRGSFSLHVYAVSSEAPPLKLNLQMAKLYIDAMEELKKEFGLEGRLDAASLVKFKDIFTFERRGPVTESDWEPLKDALQCAFGQLEDWRIKEGAALNADLVSRLEALEGQLFTVEARIPRMLEAYRERLRSEMEKILLERIDDSRILLEAAIFAEKTDTAEEATRLKSHLEMFRKILGSEEPVGKKLDFLCQEIGREINTIGSKANDIKITQTVVEMKGELEKIREQVQNLE